jgi:hypothetical protein
MDKMKDLEKGEGIQMLEDMEEGPNLKTVRRKESKSKRVKKEDWGWSMTMMLTRTTC